MNERLAAYVAERRRVLGCTKKDVDTTAGIAYGWVSHLESDTIRGRVKASTLERVAVAFAKLAIRAGYPGDEDGERRALMRAAGYIKDEPGQPGDDVREAAATYATPGELVQLPVHSFSDVRAEGLAAAELRRESWPIAVAGEAEAIVVMVDVANARASGLVAGDRVFVRALRGAEVPADGRRVLVAIAGERRYMAFHQVEGFGVYLESLGPVPSSPLPIGAGVALEALALLLVRAL